MPEMDTFEQVLGYARFDRMAAIDRQQEQRIAELERLVSELTDELHLASEARLIMLDRIGRLETR